MKNTVLTIALLIMTGCSASLPLLKTVDNVDIKRFMGPWYVIACIPTLAIHLALQEHRRGEVKLLLAAGLLGFLFDTSFVAPGWEPRRCCRQLSGYCCWQSVGGS